MPPDQLEALLIERSAETNVAGAMAFENRWSQRMEIESFSEPFET